jgi:diguanylate cyclase (GGDEF)-like protein
MNSERRQVEDMETELLRRRIDLCRSSTMRGLSATPISAPMIAFAIRQYTSTPALISWVVLVMLSGFVSLAMTYWHRQLFGNSIRAFGLSSAMVGISWGLLPFMVRPADPIAQSLLIIVVVSVGAVGATVSGPNPMSFHAVALPLFGLTAYYLMNIGDSQLNSLTPLILPVYGVFAIVHREAHKGILKALVASLRNEHLVDELEHERSRIEATNGALTAANAQLTHRTAHDPLTGLLNRVGLAERLTTINSTAAPGVGVAVMFLDLDGFKLVNDSLGHEFGDRLLAEVAKRCLESGEHSAFARLGGDEFCAVLFPVATSEEARKAAESLRSAFDHPFMIDDREVGVTSSIGVAIGYGETAVEDLRRSADLALYRAKANGRNQVALFDEQMQVTMSRVASQGSEMRRAFQDGRIVPWYQPQIDLKTGSIVGAEALARWIDGDEVRDAGEFMRTAHDVGLELSISDRIMHNVLRDRGLQHQAGLDITFRYWVNVTPQQLCDQAHFDVFLTLIERFNAPGCGLGIEVTENDLIRDLRQASYSLESARAHGVAIALDDFGTGHSSLSLLQTLPLDAVKIDRSFVRDLEVDARDRALARTIVSLAHELGLNVTAEGVENGKQADILREMGCDSAQGFLYSKAVPEDHLHTMSLAHSSPLLRAN